MAPSEKLPVAAPGSVHPLVGAAPYHGGGRGPVCPPGCSAGAPSLQGVKPRRPRKGGSSQPMKVAGGPWVIHRPPAASPLWATPSRVEPSPGEGAPGAWRLSAIGTSPSCRE